MSLFKLDGKIFRLGNFTKTDLLNRPSVRNPIMNKQDEETLKKYVNGLSDDLEWTGWSEREVIQIEAFEGIFDYSYVSFAKIKSKATNKEYVWKELGAVGLMWCLMGKSPDLGPVEILDDQQAVMNLIYAGNRPVRRDIGKKLDDVMNPDVESPVSSEGSISEESLNNLKEFTEILTSDTPFGRTDMLIGLADFFKEIDDNLGDQLTDDQIDYIFGNKPQA